MAPTTNRKLNIYVDIDETICNTPDQPNSRKLGRDYKKALPIPDNIEKVNKLYDEGHSITYWTARGTVTNIDWYDITLKQLKSWDCKFHKLLLNKPAYDLYIDDKSLNSVHHWTDENINRFIE
jgi:hypothetical protein